MTGRKVRSDGLIVQLSLLLAAKQSATGWFFLPTNSADNPGARYGNVKCVDDYVSGLEGGLIFITSR